MLQTSSFFYIYAANIQLLWHVYNHETIRSFEIKCDMDVMELNLDAGLINFGEISPWEPGIDTSLTRLCSRR